MKRYVYVLAFLIALGGLIACSKSDPTPTSPAVGRWELNRGLLSGFPTSTTANINGESLDLYSYDVASFASRIDIFSDNTFNENQRQLFVDDAGGTWTFTDNTLTLTYDVGGTRTYTYSKNKNIEELTATAPFNFTAGSGAVGKIQFIYRK